MEAAKPSAAAKTLQTIDDPFFDEDDAIDRPQDAGPGGAALKRGGGKLGGPPAGGPPGGRSVGSGPGPSSAAVPVGAGGEYKSDRVRQDPKALGKSVLLTHSREAQNAERAKQRRLNLLIGAGVLGMAVIVLLFLAVMVFSGSHGKDGNVTAATPHVIGNDNNTDSDYDYGIGQRRLQVKHETTPEEYEYENYEVTAPGETGSATFNRKGEAGSFFHAPETPALKARGREVGRKVTRFQVKSSLPLSKAFTTKHGTQGVSVRKSLEKRKVIRIWENSQNPSTYPQQEKTNDTFRKSEDNLESSVSAATCSAPCKTRLVFLINQLDPKYSPCKNLYEHVCSKWQTRYSSLADRRGSYSVDESILDEFQARLASHLLTTHQVPFQESRQFFADCVNGTLVTEGQQKLLGYLKIDNSTISAEALAETIVRASLVGVSPFFDVTIKKKGTDFFLTLLPPSFETRNQDLGHNPEDLNWTQLERHKQGGPGKNHGADIVVSKEFLQAIERQLCRVVIREHGSGANCFLTPDSDITPPWNYEWYKSSGLRLLALHVASFFWPALAAPATTHTENDSFFDSNFEISNYSIRVEACLRLLERYDPDVVMHSALAVAGNEFVKRGKAVLESLKMILEQRIHGAANISLKFGSPVVSTSHSSLLDHTSDHDGSPWPLNATKLEKYLLRATWKRWTQGIHTPEEVLSTSPTIQQATSTVHVPLPVFDLTSSVQTRWLWHLSSIARVGPRFLKPFLLSVPSKRANDSDLLRCLRNQSTDNSETTSKTKLASLDVEEVASFAYSLEAFHSLTAGEATATGYNVSTDALFLYYYVFNKCRALPSVEDRNNTSSTNPSRREVDSVAMAFGGSLLPECTAHPDIHGCLLETIK